MLTAERDSKVQTWSSLLHSSISQNSQRAELALEVKTQNSKIATRSHCEEQVDRCRERVPEALLEGVSVRNWQSQ